MLSRVSDPYSFNADPDPAFFLIEDPDPDLDPDLLCEFNRIGELLSNFFSLPLFPNIVRTC